MLTSRLERSGTIPEQGDAVEGAGYCFEVEEMPGLRVRRVLAVATRDGDVAVMRPAEW
jgi:CBS domain containing-hemolysin-like protein